MKPQPRNTPIAVRYSRVLVLEGGKEGELKPGPRRLYIYLHNDVVTTSFVTDRHRGLSLSLRRPRPLSGMHSRRTRAGEEAFFRRRRICLKLFAAARYAQRQLISDVQGRNSVVSPLSMCEIRYRIIFK